MAYNPNTQTFLEFGGQAVGTNHNTTYVFNPANRTWTLLNPSNKPPGRINIETALVFDHARNVFVLFGGRLQASLGSNDTWIFDPSTNNWTEKTPGLSPPPRDLHSMVYDPVNRVVILHGGRAPDGSSLNDTWVYNTAANTWTQLAPAGTPPRIHHHSAAYDPASGAMIVVPGQGTSDTFVFRYVAAGADLDTVHAGHPGGDADEDADTAATDQRNLAAADADRCVATNRDHGAATGRAHRCPFA